MNEQLESKFKKISWGIDPDDGHENYVIIQQLANDDPQVIRHLEEFSHISEELFDKNDYVWGKLVYGSSVQYSRSGRVFYFSNVTDIQDIPEEAVLMEHFTGLL